VLSNGCGNCFCIGLVHSRDLDPFERRNQHGTASIARGQLCKSGAFIELGQFFAQGIAARFDGGEIVGFLEVRGIISLRFAVAFPARSSCLMLSVISRLANTLLIA
jgi:hypothetical protein